MVKIKTNLTIAILSLAEKNHVIATWPNVWSYEGGVFWVADSP